MHTFLFELASSEDLTPIEELKDASNRQLTMTLNRAGSFTFSLPLESQICDCLEEITTCILVKKREPTGETSIVWSGPVWTIEESTPNQVNVTAVGWLQMLEKRFISSDVTFSSTDAGEIAFSILDDSNSEAEAQGGRVWITSGTAISTQLRDRTYKAYESVLSIIQGLSDIEAGFDMEVDPSTRELNIYESLSNETDAYFEYGVNVQSVSRSSDASKIVNHFTAFGSNNLSAVAEDPDSVLVYGHMQETASLSDVIDQTILAAYANAEIAIRSQPLRIYTFTPLKSSVNVTYVPRLFDDFIIGDIVYLTVNKGRLSVDRQRIRAFSTTLVFDQNGNEQLSTIQSTAQ